MNTVFRTAPGSFNIENCASSRVGDLSHSLSSIYDIRSSCLCACNIDPSGNCRWDATYLQSISMIAKIIERGSLPFRSCVAGPISSVILQRIPNASSVEVRLNMALWEGLEELHSLCPALMGAVKGVERISTVENGKRCLCVSGYN